MLDWKRVVTICSIYNEEEVSIINKKTTYILLEGLDEIESERVGHPVDLVEEDIDEVVLNLELGELGTVVDSIFSSSSWIWLLHERLDALVEDVGDGFQLGLLVCTHSGEAIVALHRVADLSGRWGLVSELLRE